MTGLCFHNLIRTREILKRLQGRFELEQQAKVYINIRFLPNCLDLLFFKRTREKMCWVKSICYALSDFLQIAEKERQIITSFWTLCFPVSVRTQKCFWFWSQSNSMNRGYYVLIDWGGGPDRKIKLACSRSVRHDPESNIFPSVPTKLSQKAFYHMTAPLFLLFLFSSVILFSRWNEQPSLCFARIFREPI